MTNIFIEELGSDPVTESMGIQCESVGHGESVYILDSDQQHCNMHGIVHGAILFAMADVGMGSALAHKLKGGSKVVSLSINSSYVRPAQPGRVTAISSMIHLGRTIATMETKIQDERGKLCATFSGTFYISRK